MVDRPLTKPDHLGAGQSSWLAQNPAGLVAVASGILAFVIVAVSQPQLWATPDWRISVPAFGVTAAAATVAIARRERAYPLWLFGVGLAGAALVLGWFVMLAIVIAATAVAIAILHAVM